MVDDVPNSLQACVTHDEVVTYLQKEAVKGKCEDIKRAKNALSAGESVAGFPPEVVASVFVTLAGEADDLALRLECGDGLESAAAEAPRVMEDFIWDIEDLLVEVDDPALVECLIDAVVNLAIQGPPGARKGVVDTLKVVYEANTPDEHIGEGEWKRRAAVEGLQTLAAHKPITQ